MTTEHDPHTGQPVLRMGPDARDARLAVILVHGRGASAEDILGLAQQLRLDDVLYLAPQAAGNAWYPYSFLSPMAQNEPSLSSALNKIHSLVETLGRDQLPAARVALMGFRRAPVYPWNTPLAMHSVTQRWSG